MEKKVATDCVQRRDQAPGDQRALARSSEGNPDHRTGRA